MVLVLAAILAELFSTICERAPRLVVNDFIILSVFSFSALRKKSVVMVVDEDAPPMGPTELNGVGVSISIAGTPEGGLVSRGWELVPIEGGSWRGGSPVDGGPCITAGTVPGPLAMLNPVSFVWVRFGVRCILIELSPFPFSFRAGDAPSPISGFPGALLLPSAPRGCGDVTPVGGVVMHSSDEDEDERSNVVGLGAGCQPGFLAPRSRIGRVCKLDEQSVPWTVQPQGLTGRGQGQVQPVGVV